MMIRLDSSRGLNNRKVDGQTKETLHTFLDDMDAIAYGVQAWFEENTGYSRRVTETTIDIARALEIPEDEIKRWAARRSTFNAQRVRPIKSILQRLRSSPPADGLKTGSIKRSNPG